MKDISKHVIFRFSCLQKKTKFKNRFIKNSIILKHQFDEKKLICFFKKNIPNFNRKSLSSFANLKFSKNFKIPGTKLGKNQKSKKMVLSI